MLHKIKCMSWPHCTKTHKLVWVLGNGPFPGQGPVGAAHGAGSPNQQYDFFAEQTLKISVYFMQRIKSYSIFTARQTDRRTFCIAHSLTSFVKDKLRRRFGWPILTNIGYLKSSIKSNAAVGNTQRFNSIGPWQQLAIVFQWHDMATIKHKTHT